MGFDIIKRNYERNLWSSSMVALAVKKNIITEAQYEQITGMKYVELD